jgi:hypothetical protein
MKLYADFYAGLEDFVRDCLVYRSPYRLSFAPEVYQALDKSRLPPWTSVYQLPGAIDDVPLAVLLEGQPEIMTVSELGSEIRHAVKGTMPSETRVLTNNASTLELLEEACL